jgi:hypothetical protein
MSIYCGREFSADDVQMIKRLMALRSRLRESAAPRGSTLIVWRFSANSDANETH